MATHSSEVVLHGRHAEVFTVLGLSAQFQHHVVTFRGELIFRDLYVELFGLHGESDTVLASGHVGVVEGDPAAGDHGDFDFVESLDLIEQLLEGEGSLLDDDLIEDAESFGNGLNRTAHHGVVLNRLRELGRIGLSKTEVVDR